jgi:hypothetical protein
MADRKQFMSVEPVDSELMELLDRTRNLVVTDEQLREQRISFAFGNAPLSLDITRESVVRASRTMRLHS